MWAAPGPGAAAAATHTAARRRGEAALLDRMLYRDRNQHGRTKHYARMRQLKRMWGRVLELDPHRLVLHLRARLAAVLAAQGGHMVPGPPEGATPPSSAHTRRVELCYGADCPRPTAAAVLHGLRRLRGGWELAAAMRGMCEQLYAHAAAQLSKALFMPTMLTLVALASRAAVVAAGMVGPMEMAHAALLPVLPPGSEGEQPLQPPVADREAPEAAGGLWTGMEPLASAAPALAKSDSDGDSCGDSGEGAGAGADRKRGHGLVAGADEIDDIFGGL